MKKMKMLTFDLIIKLLRKGHPILVVVVVSFIFAPSTLTEYDKSKEI